MIVGFDELVLKCLDDEAKGHIREAIRCYEGSAYRAAIVAANIAVCFDLIAKLRSLAAEGDAAAKVLIAKLESLQDQRRKGGPAAIKGLLEFERNLLEQFRDRFEFFGTEEFADLDRLRDDRNRCAHPTFLNDSLPYAPPAELARLHIRNAISHVLSQPPKQGKAALNSLQAMVLSPYFPDKVEGAVERLRSELGAARESLIKAFADELAFGYPDKAHAFSGNLNVISAIKAVLEINRAAVLPRFIQATDKLAKSGDEAAVRFSGYLVLQNSEVASAVSAGTQAALKTWLKKETADHKGAAVKKALEVNWWRKDALEAVQTLTAKQVGTVTDAPPEIVTRAAQIYATAGSWTEANLLAADCIIPFSDRFTIDDIDHIFSNARHGKADLIGSHSFRDYINSLYDKNPIPDGELVAMLAKYDLEYYERVELTETPAEGTTQDDDVPF